MKFSQSITAEVHTFSPVMKDGQNIMQTYRLKARRRLGRYLRRIFVDVEQIYRGLMVMIMMITNIG
jgi:hypothetical protein